MRNAITFYRHRIHHYFPTYIVGSIIFLSFLSANSFLYDNITYAKENTQQSTATCPNQTQPSDKSLLVVLLDRSGSLVAGSAPTDLNGYSGSATKALADLWPGQFAVIPFGNDQAPIQGPFAHTDTAGIAQLKKYIDANPPQNDANTPLGLAMQQAQNLFAKPEIGPCSKIVLITDGQPTGPGGRADEVRTTFATWFQQHGIPINIFGLKLDKKTDDGRNADNLLRAVSSKTSGTYDPVQNAQDLAKQIIGLYASWRGLDFTRIDKDTVSGNYPVIIDGRTDEATIITFHSQNGLNTPLVTKSGQAIPADKLLTTSDTHYQINRLLIPIVPDTYIANPGNDAEATVYTLIHSTLKLELAQMAPAAYTGQAFTVAAHFVDQSKNQAIVPATNAPFKATVSEVINGTTVITRQIDLFQESKGSDIFSGNFALPAFGKEKAQAVSIGSIHIIKVVATYQDATRSTEEASIPLYIPPLPPLPPPPPCHKGFIQCLWQDHQAPIIGFGIPLLALLLIPLLFLIWSRKPRLRGYLQSKRNSNIRVALNKHSELSKKLFHPSSITANEILNHPDALNGFNFEAAQFTIKASRTQQDYIIVAKNSTPVVLKTSSGAGKTAGNANMHKSEETLQAGKPFPLHQGDTIIINNREEATYELAPKNVPGNSFTHSRYR